MHAQFKHDCAITENSTKTWPVKIFNFLGGFFKLKLNSQSDFVLISTTFFNMDSRNETTRGIYPGFSDCYMEFVEAVEEAVVQTYFAGLPFFIEPLWWLLLNIRFKHQH